LEGGARRPNAFFLSAKRTAWGGSCTSEKYNCPTEGACEREQRDDKSVSVSTESYTVYVS